MTDEQMARLNQLEAENAELRLYKETMERRVQIIKDITREQSADETRGHNPSAWGYANGFRNCVSILKGEDMRLKPRPIRWTDPNFVKLPMK